MTEELQCLGPPAGGATDALGLAQLLAFGKGEELPPETLAWLREGLRRYLQGEADLEVALRLTGAARIAARNRALLQATKILDDGRGLTPWKLAGDLEMAITRFESDVLPRVRRGDLGGLSPLNRSLHTAFQSGARTLRSRRRLYEILVD